MGGLDRRYYRGTVVDRDDPELRGRLRIKVPEITGPTVAYPGWIAPRVAGGPDASSFFWVPVVDAVVLLEADRTGTLRWLGGEFGDVNRLPDLLRSSYPNRVGFSTPEGAHGLVMSGDDGLLVEVVQNGVKRTVKLTPAGLFEVVAPSKSEHKATAAAPVFAVVKSTLNTPLANALTEISTAMAALGLPTTQTAIVIAGLQAGTYNAVTLRSD